MAFTNGKYHHKMVVMLAMLMMDKAGRFVLPKPVRDEMHLLPGDELEMESSEDKVVLRPRRGTKGLHKKEGIWVFSSRAGVPISAETTDGILQEIRRERELSLLGNLAPKNSRRKRGR
jgi:AbrB family looped-hinge helix DNA binding protein